MKSNEYPFHIPRKGGHFLSAVLHNSAGKDLVIFSHGFTGTKCESGRLFIQAARNFSQLGINVLRFDFMGSGDSSGDFEKMTPNTEIEDLKTVIRWSIKQGYRKLGLLGLSFGGAISICAAADLGPQIVKVLVTWSSVPSLRWWRSQPEATFPRMKMMNPGARFYTDRPKIDVPEAYLSLQIPKLQIQGDRDIAGFRERFSEYFPRAAEPRKHRVIPGADHVFTHPSHRRLAIQTSIGWFKKYLHSI